MPPTSRPALGPWSPVVSGWGGKQGLLHLNPVMSVGLLICRERQSSFCYFCLSASLEVGRESVHRQAFPQLCLGPGASPPLPAGPTQGRAPGRPRPSPGLEWVWCRRSERARSCLGKLHTRDTESPRTLRLRMTQRVSRQESLAPRLTVTDLVDRTS